MTYTVLGTLYNRYVLQLRGFDQIPQFSIESMKYHGSEAWDWIRDVAAQFNIGTNAGHGRGNYDGLPSAGIRTPNPVSHQAQVGNLGPQDLEGGSRNEGFVRPQRIPSTVNPFQRAEINPVSHHSQSLSFSASNQHSSPPLAHPQPQTPTQHLQQPQSGNEFTLEDEDEGEELVDVKPPQSSSPPSSQNTPPAANIPQTPGSPTTPTNAAAAARGRDLGSEGTIQL